MGGFTVESFLVFLCSHVYLLNYKSELAQICGQDTIHDQYFNAGAVRNSGCSGRVVLEAYFQMVFRTDLAHFRLQFNTHLVWCGL